MRNKHVEPKQQPIVDVTLICDRYGAAACVTSPLDPTVQGTGIAKKAPGDPNDVVIATNLAVGEALRDLGQQMLMIGAAQVTEAMVTQTVERVEAGLRRMRRHVRGEDSRTLLSLSEIQKEWGKKAAKVAATRRGVEWPPKKKDKS
jgi:hypothetical protein